MNREQELLLIRHLYGEDVDRENLHEILEDPEIQLEYEKLLQVKSQLGNSVLRRHVTTPAGVVDHVFVAAAQAGSRRFWSGPVRRSGRLILLSSVGAVAACVLFLLFLPGTDPSPVPEPVSATEELEWDDTQERIEMQRALSVVRQRTSPELWDESDVVNLDSLQQVFDKSPSGLSAASTVTPQ